jgi:hypothetical protein
MFFQILELTGTELIAALVGFIITLLVMGFVIYLAGKIVVGDKATFGGAVAIAAIGSIVSFVLNLLIPFIGGLLAIIAWWFIIKNQFDTGYWAALAIGILAVIISVIISIAVAVLFGLSLDVFSV